MSINQGLPDATILPAWSQQSCEQMKALGKTVECHFCDGQPHTFRGERDQQSTQNMIEFFDRFLRGH